MDNLLNVLRYSVKKLEPLKELSLIQGAAVKALNIQKSRFKFVGDR